MSPSSPSASWLIPAVTLSEPAGNRRPHSPEMAIGPRWVRSWPRNWPAQPDVADADLCPAQPGGRLLHQLEPVARGREGEPVRALVRLRLAAAHRSEERRVGKEGR